MSRRTDRVADLIRKELSILLLREVSDPRIRLATLSAVTVAPNLEWAKVSVSVLGDDDQREECLQALRKAAGYLRTLLGKRLDMRTTPQLQFTLDRGAEYSMQISQLLDELVSPEDSTTTPPGDSDDDAS
jgi:ribosome-binding factor A